MMFVTSAARRLLRTLSLSQPTVMTDLQRTGRDGPATWCAAAAGTDSSSTSSCFELTLWPSQSANSRPLPPSSFSHSSSIPPSADHNAARPRIDTSSSHQYILDPETKPSPATSQVLLPRTNSSDSISSSASTLVSDTGCANDNNEGTRNKKPGATTGIPPIIETKTGVKKKGSGDEACQLFWRGYWD